MPLLFEPAKKQQWSPLVVSIAGWGISGYILLVILFALPLVLLLIPLLNKKKNAVPLFEPKV